VNKQDERIYRPRKALLTLVAAAAIATAAALPAGAQSTVAFNNDPVRIVHYSVGSSSVPVSSWGGNYLGFANSGDISISFVNARGVAATQVEFALRAGKATEILVDKGTFSPGTSITHDFPVGAQFSDTSAVEVVSVTFADGTSWERSVNRAAL
jgi:hypothetical protein